MGVDARKPPLPAPTEASTVDSIADPDESQLGTDLHTDLSTRTDKTSYSIPEDGSPVTISTRRKRDKNTLTSLSRDANRSQTSLLIEYFEGGKSNSTDVQQRPSVRVKVTPSAARKIRDVNDHIQITETKGEGRVPSYTRRISLAPNTATRQAIEAADDKSLSSLATATEESNLTRGLPLEVEILDDGDDHSIPSPRHRRFIPPNPSEISAMPSDSFVDNVEPLSTRSKTETTTRESKMVSQGLAAPPARSRSVSRERLLAQKVVGKLEKDKEVSGRRKRRSKSRSRSVSKEHIETVSTPRRRSSRSQTDEALLVRDERASQATGSQVSQRSAGQESMRSVTSTTSSINNPKLLATVEDVIRRLVLPQITEIKQEQRSQRNRESFNSSTRRDSSASIESASREASRRLSKTSSAPDGVASKVVLNEAESSTPVKSSKSRKSRKSDRGITESPTDRDYAAAASHEDLVLIPKKRSKRPTTKELAGAGAATLLTSEALSHHDSRSTLDGKERRRKRSSKSRSRSASVSEAINAAHHEPIPMPMSSDITSELTRESILTERTERPPSAASQDRRISGTRSVATPDLRTPTKTPIDVQKGLGTHHTNASREHISLKSGRSSVERLKHSDLTKSKELGSVPPAVVIDAPGVHHVQDSSPIQSVASYNDHNMIHSQRDSLHHVHSEGSLSSLAQVSRRKPERQSTDSLSDSPSARMSHQRDGPAMEAYVVPGRQPDVFEKKLDKDYWDEQHLENNRNRNTFDSATTDRTVDYSRFTQSTDNGGGNYLDKVAAGQHVLGVGANPEYRYTPVAAQSAVASLHEASIMDSRSLRSEHSKLARQSYPDSLGEGVHRQTESTTMDYPPSQQNSPTKRAINTAHSDQSTSQRSFVQRMAEGEAPAVNQDRPLGLLSDSEVQLGTSALPTAHDTLPQFEEGINYEDGSDILTNPSIIQGVASREYPGLNKDFPLDGSRSALDSYDGKHSVEDGLGGTNPAVTNRGLDTMVGKAYRPTGAPASGHVTPAQDLHMEHGISREPSDRYMRDLGASPTTGNKDEGYISAAPNAVSPRGLTPDQYDNGPKLFDDNDPDGVRGIGDFMGNEDPFVGKGHTRNLSGFSYGVPSPLYDSATGKGLDRIQSKDIVALMDHLTVRDAQRNARDTEILVTLVRSAAEMRNSFEDMKRLLGESEKNIITGTDRSTERIVQKHIQGPRPQPLGTPRFPRQASADGDTMEDLPTKRRNVFTRALKGLRMRSTNDLTHIEDMLLQLLTEVETLKDAQGIGARDPSISHASDDNLPVTQDGYEPEGNAGTSTNTTHSGFLSNSSSRQPMTTRSGYDGRRVSEHRISTVPEGDEDMDEYEDAPLSNRSGHLQNLEFEQSEERLTPSNEARRRPSMPLETPTKAAAPPMPLSAENTPRTDRSKKHKSGGSSIFPKFSRWSETTASTVARFKPGRKSKEEPQYQPQQPLSRSGSELEFWAGPQGPSDKLHSTYSLEEQQRYEEMMNNRPPSPLVPSEVDDQPQQQAFRNSMNLEHPRPRPGPTDRYQTHLETQAQHFDSPVSPSSDQWGSNPVLKRYSTGSNKRYSAGGGGLSPISDGGYSQGSAPSSRGGTAPPRPPKIPDDPLVPQGSRTKDTKPNFTSPLSAGHLSPYGDENVRGNYTSTFDANDSPRSSSGQFPARKPVGPRPPSSGFSTNSPKRNPHRDTFGASPREEDVTF